MDLCSVSVATDDISGGLHCKAVFTKGSIHMNLSYTVLWQNEKKEYRLWHCMN